MARGRLNRTLIKLLIAGTMCAAAVVAIVISRDRGASSGDGSNGVTERGGAPQAAEGQGDVSSPVSLDSKLAARLARVEALTDPNEQATELQKLAEDITLAEIPNVLEALQNSARRSLDAQLRMLLVARWVRADAALAADWVEQKWKDSLRDRALKTVSVTWAEIDSVSALEWARHLHDADDRSGVLTSLAYEIARNDPASASALVAELSHGERRDELAVHLAGLWAATSPSKALEWAASLSGEELRGQVITAITAAWSDSDPVSAATLAVQSLPAGKVQEDAVVSVVQRWAQQDPLKASAWVTAFPEGTLRDTAIQELVKLWADQDSEKAGKWLSALEAGRSRDIAAGAYASVIVSSFPRMAADWTIHIGDDALRDAEMKRVMKIWLDNDAKSARGWIAEADLSAARKSDLLALKPE